MFLQWLGYARTPFTKVPAETFPCLQWISLTTGERVDSGSPTGQACGVKRYCLNCETFLNLLLRTGELPTLVDSMVALLTKMMQTWVDGTDIGMHDNACFDVDHQCGSQCSMNPSPGS